MQMKFRKNFFYLQFYCVAITLILGCLFVFGFTTRQKQKFDEIEVKRLNLVDEDGKLRMTIANKDRQHPGMADGKLLDRKRNSAGMLFFDENGNECGGLIFENFKTGENYRSFTFDRFRGDQTIALQHMENQKGQYWAGLVFADDNIDVATKMERLAEIRKMPDVEARKAAIQEMLNKGQINVVPRLTIGKERDSSAGLTMADAKGKTRIRMSVAAGGTAKLEFFDENGKVIYSLPKNDEAKK